MPLSQKLSMEKLFNKYIYYLIALACSIFFLVVKNDPFHGDAVTSTAKVALNIYDNNLQTIWYPPLADPGHPTLFPYLLAVCWTIFGKSLWVAHALIILIGFCTILVLRKIALLFTTETKANTAVLLSCMYSVFVAQQALLLNTPLFFLWVLLCLYSLITKRTVLFIVSSVLMEITHLQANFFLLAFGFIYAYQCYETKQNFGTFVKNGLMLFLPASITLALWLWAHQMHFGWAFLSPNYTEHNNIKGAGQFIQSVFLIIWRLVDNGMLIPYMLFIYVWAKKQINKKLFIYTAIILLVNSICMAVFLYNTIGHRYFLISQFMVLLLVIAGLPKIKWPFITMMASLLIGNYMYYPGKVIADSNLQYRSFFAIEKRIMHDFGDSLFYSYAPISTGGDIRYLDKQKGLNIQPLNDLNMDALPMLLQSNVNAEFTKPQRDSLYKNWHGHTYEQGAIYVNVFLNPAYNKKPAWFHLREPSWFEMQLQSLKYKIRGE